MAYGRGRRMIVRGVHGWQYGDAAMLHAHGGDVLGPAGCDKRSPQRSGFAIEESGAWILLHNGLARFFEDPCETGQEAKYSLRKSWQDVRQKIHPVKTQGFRQIWISRQATPLLKHSSAETSNG